MKCGVLIFPGSNCDHDAYHVLKHVLGCETTFLWHDQRDLDGSDLVVVPGGFSYGDYLRAGALAARSPILGSVREFAERGGTVLGICNGFQILQECRLLPGALRRNQKLRFECRDVYLKVERVNLAFTCRYELGSILRVPIAHSEGNFKAKAEELNRIEEHSQVVFRYVSPEGRAEEAWNVNGSTGAIAGVVNRTGNVLGMMPHPERCAEEVLGNTDGLALFEGLVESLAGGVREELVS